MTLSGTESTVMLPGERYESQLNASSGKDNRTDDDRLSDGNDELSDESL